MITMMYLSMEIASDWVPLPRPSRAPLTVTDSAEGIKPMLMIFSADAPSLTVSGLVVNIASFAPLRRSYIPPEDAFPVRYRLQTDKPVSLS